MTTDAVERAVSRPIRTTWPVVWRALWPEHRTLILGLILLSVALAVVPSLKTQFESATLNSVSDVLRTGTGSTFTEALSHRLPSRTDGAGDVVEKIAAFLLHESTLTNIVAVYLVLIAATFGVELGATFLRARLTQSVLAALRTRAMRNALMLETSDLGDEVNVSGQYANAIQQGAESVTNMYEHWFRMGDSLLSVAFGVIAVWSKSGNAGFAVWIAVIAATLLGVSHWQHRRLKREREEFDVRRNDLLAQTDDILSKREILAAYEQQDRYTDQIRGATVRYADVSRRLEITEERFAQLSKSVRDAGRLVVLLAIVYLFVGSKRQIDVFFFVLLYGRLLGEAQELISRYSSLRRAQATARTFLTVFARRPKNGDAKLDPSQMPDELEGGIRFEKVAFAYPAKEGEPKKVLNGLSFEVPRGGVTLLVGPSGSGKSTLARLALGFWQAQSGRVLVNDRDVREYESGAELRLLMSYVAQGDHIVDATIRENLAWATRRKAASDVEMQQALKDVGLARFPLDVQAKKLSLGEQQRLSVARLMLDQSPILILDEPLSGADVFTSAALLEPLRDALQGRTALIISHKLSLASLATNVIVLDKNAHVIDEGAPKARIAAGQKFSEIYAAAQKELTI